MPENIIRFTLLETLYCDENYLISLPPLPESLRLLSCLRNKLRSLPPLPQTLEYLFCSYNPLNSLPPLPESLLNLYCDKTGLTSDEVLKAVNIGYNLGPVTVNAWYAEASDFGGVSGKDGKSFMLLTTTKF